MDTSHQWGGKQTDNYIEPVVEVHVVVDQEQYTRILSYHGQPSIFNMLHTFGGQMAMFRRVDRVNKRPVEAREMANSSMVGTGFTMEGIHNSYIMYDLMREMEEGGGDWCGQLVQEVLGQEVRQGLQLHRDGLADPGQERLQLFHQELTCRQDVGDQTATIRKYIYLKTK